MCYSGGCASVKKGNHEVTLAHVAVLKIWPMVSVQIKGNHGVTRAGEPVLNKYNASVQQIYLSAQQTWLISVSKHP